MKKFPFEHSLWLLAVIAIFSIVLVLPWFTAEAILPYIMLLFIISLAFLYFQSKRLYIEAHNHRNDLVKKINSRSGYDRLIRNIIKHSPDGIIVIDENQQIVFISPKMEKISGYKNEEIIGLKATLFQFEGIKDYPPLTEALFQDKKSPVDKIIENKFKSKSGKEVVVEANCMIVLDDDNYLGIGSLRTKE